MMSTDEKPESMVNAVVAEKNLQSLVRQVDNGTYLSQHNYMSGWVDLYAPEVQGPNDMALEPWTLKIEKCPETKKKVTYQIKPQHAYEAFKHVGLVAYRTDWHWAEDPRVSAEKADK